MINKKLKLSLIIPAYNEERYLSLCLDAIASQEDKPDQVIVIDNNSTDRTCEIAESYSFVTLLHESKQHQAFAQITGFEYATSDIIARIDADTILHPSWVANAKQYFINNPSSVAISGPGNFYDVPLKAIAENFFHLYHSKLASKISGHGMLWGANCAFRRSALLKADLMPRADTWEDYDLAFALAPYGKIEYCKSIKAGCSFRSAHKKVSQLLDYQLRGIRTYKIRASKMRFVAFALIWSSMLVFIPFTLVDRLILAIAQTANSKRFSPSYPASSKLPQIP